MGIPARSPHSSCVNLLKLPAGMKHYPSRDRSVAAPPDARPRPLVLGQTHRPRSSHTPVRLVRATRLLAFARSKLSVVVVDFSWASAIKTHLACIFTMPHLPIASQFSSEGTPNVSFGPHAGTSPQQLEAGEGSELDEKERGSGTNTPSALLPPKNEEITGENVHPGQDSEYVVWWNEPADEDPENPLNWSSKKKWLNILTIAVISFLV